jgi:hypothetical protein
MSVSFGSASKTQKSKQKEVPNSNRNGCQSNVLPSKLIGKASFRWDMFRKVVASVHFIAEQMERNMCRPV